MKPRSENISNTKKIEKDKKRKKQDKQCLIFQIKILKIKENN